MQGRNTYREYSWKVLVVVVWHFFGSMLCTRAAPSTIGTSTSGTLWFGCTNVSRHGTNSDFVCWCTMLFEANEGGQAWFSCSKNVSRSAPRAWHEMYILEKSWMSVLRLVCLVTWLVSWTSSLIRSSTNLWYCVLPRSSIICMVATTSSGTSTFVLRCRYLNWFQGKGCQGLRWRQQHL